MLRSPRFVRHRRTAPIATFLVAGLVVLSIPASRADAQRPLNLDFEMPSAAIADQPWGWSLGWSAFAGGPSARFALDSVVRAEGARSLRIIASDTTLDAPARGMLLQLPAAFAHGHRLTLRGALRAESLRGLALVTLEAWGDRVVLAADTARITAGGVMAQWQRFSLTIDVPRDPSIHSIVISPAVQGAGSAWFDDLAFAVDGSAMTQLGAVAEPTAAQRSWLASRSTPLLRTAAEGTAHDAAATRAPATDLASVDRIIASARVVGLGESTHGTSEFFTVKHRLIEHLVRTQGFTVFALEANQRAVARLDAWVQGGPGTAREALRSVFAVWNTEEMLALVEWMRAYNATAPTRLRVVGYDMQDHREPVDSLLAFLSTVDPAARAMVVEGSAEYRAQPSFAAQRVDDSVRARWRTRADSLVRALRARRATWLARARSAADTLRADIALHDADLYRQAATLNATLASPDRDSMMAANVDWLLRTTARGARVIVWAHDVHVSRGGDARRSFNGGAQLGAHLTRTFGHDYRAFSLLTREGTYTATRSLSDYTLISARGFPAPAGSIEALLGAIARPPGTPGLVVDLRVREDDALGGWLWTPRPVRSIGYAAYDYGFEMSVAMPLEFDGIIFVDRSSASHPLGRPR